MSGKAYKRSKAYECQVFFVAIRDVHEPLLCTRIAKVSDKQILLKDTANWWESSAIGYKHVLPRPEYDWVLDRETAVEHFREHHRYQAHFHEKKAEGHRRLLEADIPDAPGEEES